LDKQAVNDPAKAWYPGIDPKGIFLCFDLLRDVSVLVHQAAGSQQFDVFAVDLETIPPVQFFLLSDEGNGRRDTGVFDGHIDLIQVFFQFFDFHLIERQMWELVGVIQTESSVAMAGLG
jgi:hypothetical protein